MRKELNYVRIDGALGGVQDWLPDWDMNLGGCGAVTACDLCLCLAVRDAFPALCPCDPSRPGREDFIRFTRLMRPYLAPRHHGIDFLEIYLSGLMAYWRDVGYERMRVEGLSGVVPVEAAEAAVREQLDAEIPVPYLLLRHQDPALEDLEWHWFNLAGYEEAEEGLLVKAVTYGEGQWLGLRRLWEAGEGRRGGIIRIFRR